MLVTNKETNSLSLLDLDELEINPIVASVTRTVNETLGADKLTTTDIAQHLVDNQFYLPNLLVLDGAFSLTIGNKILPITPFVEYVNHKPAEDGKSARIEISVSGSEDSQDQIAVSFTIHPDCKIKPAGFVTGLLSTLSIKEKADFLLSFIVPPPPIRIPDGVYTVKNVMAEEKSTIVELEGGLTVRVNNAMTPNAKRIKSLEGFIYIIGESDEFIISGVSVIPHRGEPLSSAKEDSAKIGDVYQFKGYATMNTSTGTMTTALAVDATGKETYTLVKGTIETLISTKLSLGKIARAKVASILTPGGARKNYDVTWDAVKA